MLPFLEASRSPVVPQDAMSFVLQLLQCDVLRVSDTFCLPDALAAEITRSTADVLQRGPQTTLYPRTVEFISRLLRHRACSPHFIDAAIPWLVYSLPADQLACLLFAEPPMPPIVVRRLLEYSGPCAVAYDPMVSAWRHILQHPAAPADVVAAWLDPDYVYSRLSECMQYSYSRDLCQLPPRLDEFTELVTSARAPQSSVCSCLAGYLSDLLAAAVTRLQPCPECLLALHRRVQRQLSPRYRPPVYRAILCAPHCPSELVSLLSHASYGPQVMLDALRHPNLPKTRVARVVRDIMSGKYSSQRVRILKALTTNPSVVPDDLLPLLLSGHPEVKDCVAGYLSRSGAARDSNTESEGKV